MMKKFFSVILILMFININKFTVLAINQNNLSNQTDILNEQKIESEINKLKSESDKLLAETEKIKLETKKISKETSWVNISPMIQISTVFVAFITAMIALYNSRKTNKNQIKVLETQMDKNQKDHISNLLRDLANSTTQIAAIQGLSCYESAIPYLISVLKTEVKQDVVDAIYMALSEMPGESLKKLILENKVLFTRQKKYAIKLIALEVNKSDIVKNLDLDEAYLKIILNSKEDIDRMRENISRITNEDSEIYRHIERDTILSEWRNYSKYLTKIIKAIQYVINVASIGKVQLDLSCTNLSEIELDNKDISEWNFEGSYLYRAMLNGTICNKTNFQDIFAKSSEFGDAKLNYSSFDHAFIDNSYFANAELEGTSFRGCRCNRSSFGGTYLKNTTFDNIHMEEGKFSGSNGENISFKYSAIFRSEFMNVKYQYADFTNSKLNHTRFDKAIIKDSKFINVEMDALLLNEGILHGQFDIESKDMTYEIKQNNNLEKSERNNPDFSKSVHI